MQIIFQYKALHGPLEICKHSKRLRWGEGGGKGGSTKLSWTVPLLWIHKNRNPVFFLFFFKQLEKMKLWLEVYTV